MEKETQNDHDILISFRAEMISEMRAVQCAIKELKDGTSDRIHNLEVSKAEADVVATLEKKLDEDVESRIRKLEAKTANYVITLSLYTIFVGGLAGVMIYHIFK